MATLVQQMDKLKKENDELRKTIDIQNQRINDLQSQIESMQLDRDTQRYGEIPDKSKRGRKPTISAETRQYVHELAKFDNSLSQISKKAGISKSKAWAILREPPQVGRWYSVTNNGDRVYYADYQIALQSDQHIHWEPDLSSNPK